MRSGNKTNWIWIPNWTSADKEEAGIVLFRKQIFLNREIRDAKIRITADSKYKLYINGTFVEVGPMKGDNQVHYVDEINLKHYLRKGENRIAVMVLAYPTEHDKGNHGVFRTGTPGLYVKGYVKDSFGWQYDISADGTWKCKKADRFHIVREAQIFSPLMFFENTQGEAEIMGWMLETFDDSMWDYATMYEPHILTEILKEENLKDRTIPFMRKVKKNFCGVINAKKSMIGADVWNQLLCHDEAFTLPKNREEIIEISAGEETTGFLNLYISGGLGAKIEILYSEAYVQREMVGVQNLPLKTDRMDFRNGILLGFTDCYQVCGAGTHETPEIFSPFWFRTFRFIRIRIRTQENPLRILHLGYTEVGYPLEVRTEVETSDPTHRQIWEISERTLRRCMHETYEDCPYYEQLQYAQDSRLQILYTYAISGDDRLARQCMDDFRRGQYYNGLINCSYPNYEVNIIPGFSIYYVLMVYDHMMYFGDKKLVREHMPAIERILDYFESNLTEKGYVKKIGGVNGEQTNWSFVDWTPEWDETGGVPAVTRKGPITMESLLYLMGLQKAAELAEYIGWPDQALDFRIRANNIKHAIKKYCLGKNGMIQDGPEIDVYSQHCQVFGILTDIIQGNAAKEILKETIVHSEKYAQCTVAMAFYLFRALEKMNLYEYTNHYWNIWRNMIRNNCTTCTEAEAYGRSECHAWGALILYELPSTTLGVRPAVPGYEEIAVHPVPGYLTWAKGTVHTPKGDVKVEWKKDGQGNLTIDVQSDMEEKDKK